MSEYQENDTYTYTNDKNEEITIDEAAAKEQLEKGFDEAKSVLQDEDKIERLLQRLEVKLNSIPVAGKHLATLPILVSLVKSYVKKEYTDLPIGTMIAIVSALLYFVAPIDLLPDSIPFIGYFDDAAVVATCWKLVESDVAEYQKWRKENGKVIDF